MTYLRSIRFPEEVKAPMQEEAARRGLSVNRFVAEVVTEALGVSSGSTAQAQVLAADEQPKPRAARKSAVSSDGGSNPPTPAKRQAAAAGAAKPSKPAAECRHGLPDCRICQTGRYAT